MGKKSLLPAVWDIPQRFRDRLGAAVGRQRAMFHEGHLLLVLHTPPQPEDATRKGRFFWRKPDGTWTSNETGSGPGALTRHLEEYAELLSKYDDADHQAENAGDYFDVLYHLGPLVRSARNMHQVLQSARELVAEDEGIINFRDRAYQIERTAELLYSDAKNALDFTIAQRAEEQAESSYRMSVAAHRLNLLAAFFFPLATLGAVFGVNLLHGWENSPPRLAWMIMIGIGLVCGVILTSFITKVDSPKPSRPGRHAHETKT